MELALYDPELGFYSSGGRAGRRGDFLTSPEVGPLFGALIAEAIDREWERLDRPERFDVVDAGAGPGTLARSVLAASPRCSAALRYRAVERSATQRETHPEHVVSAAELPAGPIDGVVLANELLDNMPFQPVHRDGDRLRRVDVDCVADTLVEVEGPEIEVPGLVPGPARAIAQPDAVAWLRQIADRMRRGRLIVVDYCRRRSRDVEVRTYTAHGPGRDPLVALGSQDVTVDVDLAQLGQAVRPPDSVATQAEWLRDLGIDELVEEGRTVWRERAAIGDLDAIRARSRVREAEALSDTSGLGGFTVAEWIFS